MLDTHLREVRELEDHYWWFVARRRLALALLDDAKLAEPIMLDAGFGAGALLADLSKRGQAIGVDVSPSAIALTRERGLTKLVQADLADLPFGDATIDAVTLCDVLEHVPDDQRALSEAGRVLRPGGLAIITLPALRLLWGAHDEALGHYRRYHSSDLRRMAERAGLRIERTSYGLFFLFPIALVLRSVQRLLRRWRKRAPETGIIRVPDLMNRVLVRVMDWENALIRRMSLPIGVSLVAVARRIPGPAGGTGGA